MFRSFFGSNNPLVLMFLAVPALCYGLLAARFASPPTHFLGGAAFDWLMNSISDFVWLRLIAGVSINLLCAILVSSIVNAYQMQSRENYLPGLFYFLVSCLQLDWLFLNPVLLANLFVLLALRNLLALYRTPKAQGKIFNAALILALGICFFPPLAISILVVWMGLMQLRPFDLKEWLIPLVGFLVPTLYMALIYWWCGYTLDVSEYTTFSAFSFSNLKLANSEIFYPLFVALTILCTIGIFLFLVQMSQSTVHRKNSKKLLLWTTFLLLSIYLYTSTLQVQQFAQLGILAIPVAVFSSELFLVAKKRRLLTFIFYVMLLLLLSFPVVSVLS